MHRMLHLSETLANEVPHNTRSSNPNTGHWMRIAVVVNVTLRGSVLKNELDVDKAPTVQYG